LDKFKGKWIIAEELFNKAEKDAKERY